MMRKKAMRALLLVGLLAVMISMCSMTAFAAGDVAGAIEQTWNTAKAQIQTVVNNVVFPVVDMILAIGEVSTSVSGEAQHIGKPLVSTHLSRQGGDQRNFGRNTRRKLC